MAESEDPKLAQDSQSEASAEKAYAAAAEAIAEPDAVSAKARAPAPEAPKATAASADPVEALAPASQVAAESAPPTAPTEPRRQPAAKPARRAVRRAAAKPAAARPRRPAIGKPRPAAEPAAVSGKIPFIAQLKEIPMDMTSSVKDAFARTGAAVSEYGEFAKGNVEAVVESGKILAAGLQELGSTFVADSKAAFETMTGEVKELSAVKSPTDFFKLQTELLRRNLDSAVAYGSKTSEALLKLTNDAIAPISGRVTLAVEKVGKAA